MTAAPPNSKRVSVTELAREAGRTGDLGRRDFSLLRGVEGIRAHQRMQRDRGPGYRAEVPVEAVLLDWIVQGRIDGVEETSEHTVLEEYKTVRDPAAAAVDPDPAHALQLRLYGWIWERTTGVRPRLRLAYVPVEAGGTPGWVDVAWDDRVTARVADVLRIRDERLEWIAERNRALRTLSFPFAEPRPGQEDIRKQAAATFARGGGLMVEAPTGIGKTAALLHPALRAMGEGRMETLFVATCRNAGKNAIADTLRRLAEPLPGLRALTLQARERICTWAGTPCDCGACPGARGFYDRLPGGMAALRKERFWDADAVGRIAERHRLCPYALSMIAAREADVLVGDLNFALDPAARLEFLFGERPQSVGVLIDEAHHLPERARAMRSASLSPGSLRAGLRRLPPELRSGLRPELNRVLRELRTYGEEALHENGWPREEASPPHAPGVACGRALETLEVSLADTPAGPEDPRPEWFRDFRAFRSVLAQWSDAHTVYAENKRFHLFCRDASAWIRERLDAVGCWVLFSATLSPMEAMREQVGVQAETPSLVLSTPFDPERFRVTADTSISLAYRDRTPDTLVRLSERIAAVLSEDRKNTLVFFPSYALLREVAARMPPEDLLTGPIRLQPRGLQEEAARSFLAPFWESSRAGAVFAVLGGALNEGIDLPGDALSRVIVASIGLPAVCMERELLRAWFDVRGEDGFRMAYELPGVLRIRQALGRVIRGPEDRGEGLLIDARFARPPYRSLWDETAGGGSSGG